MSSPRLNNVIVAGCIMTYFSVILFGLDGGVVASEKYGQVCTVSRNCNVPAERSYSIMANKSLQPYNEPLQGYSRTGRIRGQGTSKRWGQIKA